MSSLTSGNPSAGKKKRIKRTSTQQDVDAFFLAVERLGSKTAAAAELGFNPSTAARWGRVKGVGGRAPHPGRDEYAKLRASGVHRREAARRIGVNVRTAQDWDLGIRHVSNTRIRPDGRLIDYTSGMTTLLPAVPSALEQPISNRYLSLAERETIRDMMAAGSSLRAISALLRRAPSTISREIARLRDKQIADSLVTGANQSLSGQDLL